MADSKPKNEKGVEPKKEVKPRKSRYETDPDWRAADDMATSIVVGRDKSNPYRDEDEMIEERRFLREDLYYDRMERRERSRYGRY